MSAATAEGLVTLVMLGTIGPLAGALVTAAQRQRARYETLRALQRLLAGDAPIPLALLRLRAYLATRLRVDSLALVARDGARLVVEGGRGVVPGSVAARVLAEGAPVAVADASGGTRPRRVLGVPLTASGATVGVLVVERLGDLSSEDRATLITLGAHIGLGLENARLASRQRHFTEELAARVAEATRRLEEADRAKSAFVAIASHELRTPLTALQGFSELLACRDFPPGEVRRIAGLLGREIERLVRIVNDFLDLSRVERGLAPTLCPSPLSVEPAIRTAVGVFQRQDATCRVDAHCEPGLPRVVADPDALDRILHNLLSNAVKYARPGGAVRVTARPTAGAVAIAVEDDGRGIAPESLPRVFEPYYRAPDAVAAARGTGIGLAIVKALVEGLGGAIAVESAPTRGTRVTFTLPTVS
jgi:signal transduction histidine kinase